LQFGSKITSSNKDADFKLILTVVLNIFGCHLDRIAVLLVRNSSIYLVLELGVVIEKACVLD